MRRDSRLSMSLHVLLHMAGRPAPVTSQALSECMGANPVVVRRALGGLRNAGLVSADKGHGGGWRLARKLSEISLLDVYLALDEPVLFHQHRGKQADCPVGRAVGRTLEDAYEQADALIKSRFAKVRVSDLMRKFELGSRRHA